MPMLFCPATHAEREVRLVGEDLADHACAGIARDDFDEVADAIGISCLDYFGEIEGRDGLADDGVGGGFAGDFVGFSERAAVEAEMG